MHIYAGNETEDYYFYTGGGLFVCGKNGRKALLCSDCLDEFDVYVGGNLSLVCQSTEGDIFRYTKFGEEWVKSVVLKSKSRRPSVFGMRITETENEFHFIYGLVYGNEKLIVHQKLPNGRPQVITRTVGDSFFVRRDETGCVYIICEIADKLWHFYTYRSGGWSGAEELADGVEIKDIMCTGYKKFCMIEKNEENIVFRNGGETFAVSGNEPEIVKTSAGYIVITELNGRIMYISKEKTTKIISGGTCIDFHLRLDGGGEFCICERCRGSLRQNLPRLFVVDGITHKKQEFGEGARVEFTKRIIALEARISELEKRMSVIESNLCNLR